MRKTFQEGRGIQLCYINTADGLKNLRTDEATQTLMTARAVEWWRSSLTRMPPEEEGAGEVAPRYGEAAPGEWGGDWGCT